MLYKLESLRGVAAILIIIFHSHFTYYKDDTSFVHNSWLFVDFFFILSGFVMTLAYRKRIIKGLSFYEYLVPRFFRLYPLHIFVLLLWLPFIGVKLYLYRSGFGGVSPLETESISTFIASGLFLNAFGIPGFDEPSWNGPSWSIAAEWWTYIIFFFFVFFVGARKGLTLIALTISIFFYSLLYLIWGAKLNISWDFGILRCIPAFFLGVALFGIYALYPLKKWCQWHEVIALIAVVLFVTLSAYNRIFVYAAIISFAYMVWVYSAVKSGVVGHILETVAAKKLGKYSYSIYLTHAIILVAITDIIEHVFNIPTYSIDGIVSLVINFMVVMLVIVFSSQTYKYIELPCKIFGKKLVLKK